MNKWWAQRLGTVVRAMLVSAVSPEGVTLNGDSRSSSLEGLIVYDPFAGSGTSLVEAVKMGARVVGRDINPVAALAQRQALQAWNPEALLNAFEAIEAKCAPRSGALYSAASGEPVLHYFWVSSAKCPDCLEEVRLFDRYVFARHAYPKKHPRAHAICPSCWNIVPVDLSKDACIKCGSCGERSDSLGPVGKGKIRGKFMVCSRGHETSISAALGGARPDWHMYAKLVLEPDGTRRYLPIDEFDDRLYLKARRLKSRAHDLVVPSGRLVPGHSTSQAIRWGFTEWSLFFNDRQLFGLGMLGAAIRDLEAETPEKEAFAALFSKALEFNNMFASFKGEGTGAVRSVFHNHTLKPERTPLEANLWSEAGGSGSFRGLMKQLQAAAAYKRIPSDLVLNRGRVVRKVGLSAPIGTRVVDTYDDLGAGKGSALVSWGDSGSSGLPRGSVSLVVTDPPYVDKVHYSELADFFHSWLRHIGPFPGYPTRRESTRHPDDVQNKSNESFRESMTRVWRETARVMKRDALLTFTFHGVRPRIV